MKSSSFTVFCGIPAIASILTRHDQESRVRWLYIGPNIIANKKNIEKTLGDKFICLNAATVFHQVVEDLKLPYTHWIDALNDKYGATFEWWLGAVSSRNIYHSSLFQNICYIEMFKRIFDKERTDISFAIVESPAVALTIRDYVASKNRHVNLVWRIRNYLQHQYKYILPLARVWKYTFVLIRRALAARITRIYSSRNDKPKSDEITSILISSHLIGNSVDVNGKHDDRYFPGLLSYLSAKGFQVKIHGVLHGAKYNIFSLYGRLRRSDIDFIIPEDHLKISDYLRSLFIPFAIMKIRIDDQPFYDMDVSHIAEEERWRQPYATSIHAGLIFHFVRRLSDQGHKFRQIIIWHENQVHDKALIAAARRVYPGIPVVGAQLFIHPPNFLNLYPVSSELRAGLAPDILLENSEYGCLRASYYIDHAIKCRTVASLRYRHLFSDNNISCIKDKNALLVLLPFNIEESLHILESLYLVLAHIDAQLRIVIRAHPLLSVKQIRRLFGARWPARFEFTSDSLVDILSKTAIVITMNTSSMIEAASYGIPVINVVNDLNFNQNLLHGLSQDVCRDCYSSGELLDAINIYLQMRQQYQENATTRGKFVRDLFFTPTNEVTMSSFIVENPN